MTDDQFSRLVVNLKRDGCLTSAPTVYGENGRLVVLSGNHRVQAAIKAGIEDADVIEIVSTLTDEQKVAIQLSHNSITGDDDPNVLKELYDSLGFELKEYSGLSDDAFALEDLDTTVLSVGRPLYEELVISFLPEDREAFESYLARIEKDKGRKEQIAAHYDDFKQVFETIIAVKEHAKVHNGAVALRLMAELATERMAQLTSEEA